MNNVVSIEDFKRKKDKPKVGLPYDKERMKVIKESLDRINKLMRELREAQINEEK